ncbi:TIGR02680 family protein [Clostridium sp.]|uniref:TIGR02680 family protein n=1 Tax=Clostridium sp. TaxID=1506 RepID=UPI002635ED1C|nr:TIGR02680 family protein [Clostridium sp.]
MSDRWEINKLGLVNFWHYDMEEFNLEDGKLLLRGSNGSGKSVTMQSFIPLLLDGNKSPERLDPFGSKARTIANYLLDEDTEEKTAYLYMEFKRKNIDKYITLGLGLKAVKGKPVQSWYFILSDGRRINKDLFLYRDAGEKIALTKKQLENSLGEGNFFTDSQKKYMEKVNEYLFGFDDIDSYEELLNLLISIRSPKLSKDFKPTKIYDILADSLKVLSEEDLRPMSESMENMDSYQDTLEQNKRALDGANKIKSSYDRYNRFILNEKAQSFIEINNKLNELNLDIKKEEDNLKKLKKDFEINIEETRKLKDELKKAEESYERLQNREELKLQRELLDLEVLIKEAIENKERKEKALEEKKKKEKELNISIKACKDEIELKENNLRKIIDYLEELAQDSKFVEGYNLSKETLSEIKNADLSLMDPSIKEYSGRLKAAYEDLKIYEEIKKKREEAVYKKDNIGIELQDAKKDLRRLDELLLTEREDYKVNYIKFNKENKIFTLGEEDVNLILQKVGSAENEDAINEIKELNIRNKGSKENLLRGEIHIKENFISDRKKEIKVLEEEIKELKNKKELEPERSTGVLKNRERLNLEEIPFIPFYKAVDFNKNATEDIKNKIEGALKEMGLLDALIVDEKYRLRALDFKECMEDKYLFTEPNMMRYNLSNYLKVNKEALGDVTFEAVDNVLQGIFLEDSTLTYLDEKGNFGIGALFGKGNDNYVSQYIGELSRKNLREKLIKEKEDKIQDIIRIIEEKNLEINLLKDKLSLLEKEYSKIPKLHNISEGIRLIFEKEKEIERIEAELKKLEEELFSIEEKLKDKKKEVFIHLEKLEVKTLEDIKNSIEILEEYKEELNKGNILLTQIKGQYNILEINEGKCDEITQDIDDIYYEINKLSITINNCSIKIKSINEVLEVSSIEDIQREIKECIRIKEENPKKLEDKNIINGSLEQQISGKEERIKSIVNERDVTSNKVDLLKAIFKEEEELELLEPKKEIDILLRAKEILEDNLNLSVNRTREDYSNALIESLNKNSGELRDYQLKISESFMDEVENNEFSKLRARKEIRCRIQGKEVGFLVLIEEIKKSIEEQSLLISEEERRIFEDILLNTISQKVRGKIHQSRQWVSKVNELMESMDTSSSLKLSLSWQPKKSEGEGQLDIKDIIDIFDRNGLCTGAELKALANHFSQKVKEALRYYEGSGEIRNYHSIIKEVLDYRKWYEFKLQFTKKGERKRELTNNAFDQFSGGEKAMCMYIPLFSAVYARYQKGRLDCPRVVTMDEAFAGVDENNIRDMFRLLKTLDLDYILNSQVLWGDYDTVNALAIAELIREENDDVVTVLRYKWNGREKTLLA